MRPVLNLKLYHLLGVLALHALPMVAQAAVVTWNFSGTVAYVNNDTGLLTDAEYGMFGSDALVGETFNVLVTFDTASPATKVWPSSVESKEYDNAIQSIELIVGGERLFVTTDGVDVSAPLQLDQQRISLTDDSPVDGGPRDFMKFNSEDHYEVAADPNIYSGRNQLLLNFVDYGTANMLSSADLFADPTGLIEVTRFASFTYWQIQETTAGQLNDRFSGNITSISVVPVPAAVWLFGSALAGLGWLRRAGRRL